MGWVEKHGLYGEGKTALVVGCGLGDDAELLSDLGFQVTAFDISPTAIAWCQERFSTSEVAYVVADLFAPPEAWMQAFDFVLEVHILQALPADVRREAALALPHFVAPGGQLLAICRGRAENSPPEYGPPWKLTLSELAALSESGLREVQRDDYLDRHQPPVRRFRILYQRDAG